MIMKRMNYKWLKPATLIVVASGFLFSCNKTLPYPEPITTPVATGNTILDVLNGSNYSILRAAIKRAGAADSILLSDRTAEFTFFAADDAAFAAAGIPSVAAVNTLPAASLSAIIRYNTVGGSKLTAAKIPETFPNLQLPSMLVLAAPSATLPPGLRMSIFPSKRGASTWVNNIPLTQTDILVANGVIHKTAVLNAPPSTTVKGLIATDANFTLFNAAVARADSGQVGLNRLDSVMNYVPANITLFAPTNDAVRGLFPAGTPDANIIGAFNTPSLFSAQTLRGLVAYHMMGTRAFSVNFATTPTPYNTLLTLPTTPPTIVPVIVANAGAAFTVKGLANSSASNVITKDRHAINGVVHVIDQVLRPQ